MMLLYKAWRESRTRFLGAVVVLVAFAIAVVSSFSARQPLPFREYLDLEFFGGISLMFFVITVIFLGLGGLKRERTHHTAVFTLALPVSRAALISAQVAVGLAELAFLCFVPALLLEPFSALVHQSYPSADALRYGILRLVCGGVIFATSFFLSTILRGEYTAAVASYAAVGLDGLLSNFSRPYPTNLLRIVAARWEWDFHTTGPDLTGPLPWALLSILVLIGIVLLLASAGVATKESL
jgi:ABC-type transport system involved in multi-copper enzyme maturation permease subunit